MITSKHLEYLLYIQAQVQVFHWQTRSIPEHTALGALYNELVDHTDKLIEALSGSEDARMQQTPVSITVTSYIGRQHTVEVLRHFIKFLLVELPNAWQTSNGMFEAIRDDMIASVYRCIYLMPSQ